MPAVAPIKSIKGQKNKFDVINPIPAKDLSFIILRLKTKNRQPQIKPGKQSPTIAALHSNKRLFK
jgi:hypothetical protein